MIYIKKIFKKRKDILIFLIGLALVCYPIISNYFENITQQNLIKTYEKQIDNLSFDKINTLINEVENWNNDLFQKQYGLVSSNNSKNYDDILNLNDGIMGSIEIPIINVNLPIYHGTSDEILSVGVGHLEATSLPVGGENTHSVLTSHRGLPSAKLFTRLDELEINDKFYIKILNGTLAYQIDKIEILEPKVLEKQGFLIEEGKDLVSLMTCTPYGINTHRLIITGHRIFYDELEKELIKQNPPSFREMVFYLIPVIFSIIGIFIFKKKRKEQNYASC